MPVSFELDPHARLVRSRAWDDLVEAELMDHVASMRALFATGALDDGWAQLWDFRACTGVGSLSTAAVRRMAEQNPWPVGALRVAVAPLPPVFGLTRMYQLLADLERMHVARTMEDAQAWMAEQGRPLDPPAPA